MTFITALVFAFVGGHNYHERPFQMVVAVIPAARLRTVGDGSEQSDPFQSGGRS